MTRFIAVCLVSLGLLLPITGRALEVDPLVAPEIALGGRVLVTSNFVREALSPSGRDRDSELDFADSSLLFGFSKYLFSNKDYGFAVVGLKSTEADSVLADQWYPHQLHVGVGGPRYEVLLGRSRLANTLLAFPTLRDDDFLDFTHVVNGAANTHVEEYQLYGGVVSATVWLTPFWSLKAAIQARTETDLAGTRTGSSHFNSAALVLAYDVPEAIKFDRGLRYGGIAWDGQRLDILGTANAGTRNAILAAFSYNLNSNPESTWGWDGQAIINQGTPVMSLSQEHERARAQSRAWVTALRYVRRPQLKTRWQAALNLGGKSYSQVPQAHAYVAAPSYVYRLGSGVEFLAQYQYRHYDDGLRVATGEAKEQRLVFGLSMALDHTFNETVGERGSILNLEHNMLDMGPAGGGH